MTYNQEYHRKYRQEHKAEALEYGRNYYREHKSEMQVQRQKYRLLPSSRAAQYSRRTHIPYEQVLPWFLEASLHCWLCGKDGSGLHLDHDHQTKEIRGWAHRNCNLLEGKMQVALATFTPEVLRQLGVLTNGSAS